MDHMLFEDFLAMSSSSLGILCVKMCFKGFQLRFACERSRSISLDFLQVAFRAAVLLTQPCIQCS